MKRAIVIGCPGSGKSTFARELREKTGLPLYYLDQMYWNADRTTVPREKFRTRLREVLVQEEWILDGNYGSTMELRMAACDTVFFLDYPEEVCVSGIYARMGKSREDMPWIETGPDGEFLRFIRTYRQNSRPQVMELLERYADKDIIIFHNREEAERYLLG